MNIAVLLPITYRFFKTFIEICQEHWNLAKALHLPDKQVPVCASSV